MFINKHYGDSSRNWKSLAGSICLFLFTMSGDDGMSAEDLAGYPLPKLLKLAEECYGKNEYEKSIQIYNEALERRDNVEVLVQRAHCYIKTDKYEDAAKDAARAVHLTSAESKKNSESNVRMDALRWYGVSLFHLGYYEEAQKIFQEALEFDTTGFKMWIQWCDDKIQRRKEKGQDPPPKKCFYQPEQEAASVSVTADAAASKENAGSVQPTSIIAAATGGENAQLTMPVPKIKHDWYQTEVMVIVEVRVKNLKLEDVVVEFRSASLSVTAKLPTGSDYCLDPGRCRLPRRSAHGGRHSCCGAASRARTHGHPGDRSSGKVPRCRGGCLRRAAGPSSLVRGPDEPRREIRHVAQ